MRMVSTSETIRQLRQILVIVEREIVRIPIIEHLTKMQYSVTAVADSDSAMRLCIVNIYDCIVVDLAAVQANSVMFVQLLRERTHTPIVVLGSRREEPLRLAILRAGADDYLVKPCNLFELEVRIFAILRRISMARQSARSPYIQLDPSNRSVLVNQHYVDTTPMEFAILSTLMTSPGRVFSRKELTTLMFGEQYTIGRAIDVHISNIRSKIEQNPNEPKYIVTVYGRGYMFKDDFSQSV